MNLHLQGLPDARKFLAELPAGPQLTEKQCFEGQVFQDALVYAEFRDCTFRNCTWNASLNKVRFVRCRFENLLWTDSSQCDVSWEDCQITHTKWLNYKVLRPLFSRCEIGNCALEGCDLDFATLSHTAWRDTVFLHSRLVQWVASSGSLRGVKFQSGALHDVTWADCQLHGISMQDMEMVRVTCAQSECAQLLVEDCKGKGNRWVACTLEQAYFVRLQFAQCAWSQSQWSTGAFVECVLPHVTYDGSQLKEVHWQGNTHCTAPLFDEAVLQGCSLHGAQMPGLSLRKAQLNDVDLGELYAPGLDARGAQLNRVHMGGGDFSRADLTGQAEKQWLGARLAGARFHEDAELNDVQWWARFAPGPQKKEQGNAA